MTYIVPCWEGTPLPNATIIQKLGGKHVTDRLLALLSNGKYSFPDDTFLLLRGRGGRGFSVVSRRDVVREAKERFCCIDPKNGLKPSKYEEQVLKLPDGNIVVVGEEATSAPELFFMPELAKCPKTRYDQLSLIRTTADNKFVKRDKLIFCSTSHRFCKPSNQHFVCSNCRSSPLIQQSLLHMHFSSWPSYCDLNTCKA